MSTTTTAGLSVTGQQSEELGRYALIQHSILTFQCLCGMALNVGILVLFFLMKQVRGSVYAAYMIQIAITDVLVCLTWLTFSSWIISHVRNVDRKLDKLQENETSSGGYEEFSYSDATLDVITLIYNLHFYINIFLLAAMSVERFVAVWKSLRCQRYQFNKKFTYAVSATMWLLAFLCILPNIVDRELATGISSNIKSIPANLTVDELMDDPFLRDQSEEWATLLDCIKPYTDAMQYKDTHPNVSVYVESVDGVSVTNCTIFMQKLLQDMVFAPPNIEYFQYPGMDSGFTDSGAETLEIDDNGDSIEPFDYGDGGIGGQERRSLIIYRQARESDEPKMMPVADMDEYYFAIYFAFEHLKSKSLNGDPDNSVCVPPYMRKSKIYNIVVNVTIGFFLPYLAIVCSYLGIAWMIRKRAQQRFDHHETADLHNQHTSISDLGRRMSGFFRSMAGSGGGHSTIVAQTTVGSTQTVGQHRHSLLNNGGNKTDEIPPTAIKVPTSHISTMPHNKSPLQSHVITATAAGESITKFRYGGKSSSITAAQLRRISAGSGSSAESFLTDQSSLQTSSPGVRLSQPLFIHDKNQQQRQMKRAISADSGTASITPTFINGGSQQQLNQRHHSNHDNQFIFRPTTCGDSNGSDIFIKKDILIEEIPETISETSPFQPNQHRTNSVIDKTIAPTNGGCEVNGSSGRIVTKRLSKHEYMDSGSCKKDRSRLISEVSRSSTATAPHADIVVAPGGGKTTAHRNAERHMKIARTVTAYVIVFSLCWLPQRIQLVIYTLEGMRDVRETTCHTISIVLRIISFFSVLLNPIVYATTQRDIRNYIRRLTSRVRKRWQNGGKLNKCMKTTASSKKKVSIKKNNGVNNCDSIKIQPPLATTQQQQQNKNNCEAPTTKENTTNNINNKFQQDRHNKHLERRIWLANRLARTNQQQPLMLDNDNGATPHHDDGTIDEEVLAPRTADEIAPTTAFLPRDWTEPRRLVGNSNGITTEKLNNESVL